LGRYHLAKLTSGDVAQALRALQAEGLSPRSVFLARTVLRAALNRAVKDGLLARNVAADTDPPAVAPRDPIVLSPGVVQKILEVADPELRRAVVIAVHLALRQGEEFGLVWGDVDVEHRCIYVHQGLTRTAGRPSLGPVKTARSTRVVPLTDAALAAFEEERVAQAQAREAAGARWHEVIPGLVFTDPTGAPRVGASTLDHFQSALRRAGLPKLRWHDLRGASAGLLLLSGVDLAVVSKRLGHSSVQITAKSYAGVADSLQIDASERLGRLLSPS
jgi:integrase